MALPTCALFLDIDGVLNKFDPQIEKLDQLLIHADESLWNYHHKIKANLFSKEAVSNLDLLIDRISQTFNVVIVLSSAWRTVGNFDFLKKEVFGHLNFAKYLLDVTPLGNKENEPPTEDYKKAIKRGIFLSDRGREIQFWLLENTKKYNISSYVILDDNDGHRFKLSKRHPDRFVHINGECLLNKSDVEKAYQIAMKRF